METVTFKETMAHAETPEGQKASMRIADLITRICPRQMDTGGAILPDGVKSVLSQGPAHMIWVHVTPPRVFQLKWIAGDSPAHFGQGTTYRMVRIALPYLIVLAVFTPGENNLVQLSHFNECFFRNHPLESLDDELFYPALLNCSKFHPQQGRPLSWICTQHLDRSRFINEPDTNRRCRIGLGSLLNCLLDTGFNYSSENHEESSWYTQSAKVDARISTIDKWQAATAKSPLFVLEIPWLKTGMTVRQVTERIFKNLNAPRAAPTTAGDVARLVFNNS